MLKFILGPVGGFMLGLSMMETILATVLGAMTSVIVIIFLGRKLRKTQLFQICRKKRRFSPRNRKLVIVWQRYGVLGIAFLMPLLLTPIGGSLIAVAFGDTGGKVLWYMLLSTLFWAVTLTYITFALGNGMIEQIISC